MSDRFMFTSFVFLKFKIFYSPPQPTTNKVTEIQYFFENEIFHVKMIPKARVRPQILRKISIETNFLAQIFTECRGMVRARHSRRSL